MEFRTGEQLHTTLRHEDFKTLNLGKKN